MSLVPAIFWRRHALPSRIALRMLWIILRLDFVLDAFQVVYDAWAWPSSSPVLRCTRRSDTHFLISAGIVVVFALVLTPGVRRRIQGLLGGFGRGAKNSSAAAVVATMIGGDAVEALRSAEKTLVSIQISRLTEADMANSQDSGLFEKTEKTSVGEVDGFLSHSWRDDAALKWQAMQKFKRDFEARNDGAEPKCWLDKACIDQSGDIDASLKVLPIYLLASKMFVVFAGSSYTTRLWCVVELFSYLRGGGTLERIAVEPLDLDVADAIGSFTVEKADCTVRADKQRLLGIIEASFGSTAEFNNACRNILMAKLSGSGATAKTITPMKSKRRPSAAEELSRGESLTTMLGKRSAKVAPSSEGDTSIEELGATLEEGKMLTAAETERLARLAEEGAKD